MAFIPKFLNGIRNSVDNHFKGYSSFQHHFRRPVLEKLILICRIQNELSDNNFNKWHKIRTTMQVNLRNEQLSASFTSVNTIVNYQNDDYSTKS